MRTIALASMVLALLTAPAARAQADPSSALLLNGASPAPADDAVESGRYQPRPRSGSPDPGRRRASSPPNARQSPAKRTAPDGASTEVPSSKAAEGAPTSSSASAASSGLEDRAEPKAEPKADPAKDDVRVEASAKSRPASAELPQARTDEFGEIEGVGEKAAVKPEDDRRYNLIEIEIAPRFVYNDSSSPYSHRRYSTSGQGVGAAARVWLSPGYGLQAAYASTFAGSVTDALTTNQRNVPANHEWLAVGVRSRKHFGKGARAPSLTLGADYSEYQFSVSSEAALRQKIRTYGFAVSLEGDWPSGRTYAWTMRLAAIPRARTEEISTQNNARSGSNPETNSLEAGVGGRLSFDRSNEVFWRLSHRIDQTLYSGSASGADFQTGAIPTNVSVTNSFTVFELGYSWGN